MGMIMRNRKCYTGKVRETNPLEWKYLGSETGTVWLSLPDTYNELYVSMSASGVTLSGILLPSVTGTQVIVNGYFALTSGGNMFGASASVNKQATHIRVGQMFINNTEYTSSAVMEVYYR